MWNLHVDPGGTSLKLSRDADGTLVILGVNAAGKTICGIVGHLNDFLLRFELGDSQNWAEDLLAHNLHVGLDVGEDGGFDEVSLALLNGLATEFKLGAFIGTRLDVSENLLILHLGVLRTLVDVFVEVVTDLDLLETLDELLDELIIDILVNINSRTSVAGLAEVEVDAPC